MKRILLLLLLLSAGSAYAQKEYITIKNIPYYSDSLDTKDQYKKERCAIDVYYPKDSKSFGTIVWFHGGGIINGSRQLPSELMKKGYAVIGVGYRLSPNVKSPVYIEDAAAAVAWVFKNIGNYGGDSRLIFLSGHSAGAYLAMMITLDKKYLGKYKIDANKIAGIIPFSGQAITHFTIRNERGMKSTQPLIDEYAPLYHVRADAPPMLLITGDRELELFGRYEENAFMWRMMKLAGHKRTKLYEMDGYGHNMALPAYPLLWQEVEAITKEITGKK